MGLFGNTEKKEAEIRGATKDELKAMDNEKIIMLSLFRIMVGQGFDDCLSDELRGRAISKPNKTVESSRAQR